MGKTGRILRVDQQARFPDSMEDSSSSCYNTNAGSWRNQLDLIPAEWRLISCNGFKQPCDPLTGSLLNNWSENSYSPGDFKALSHVYVKAAGLLLGPKSGGILAVDFDASGYEEVFAQVTGRPTSELPDTVAWTSGRPGRSQRAYRVKDAGVWQVMRGKRAWKNQGGKTCLEFRWSGHQSVILGAHPETDGYRWCDGLSPQEVEIAEAPEWLFQPLLIGEPTVVESKQRVDKADIDRAIELLKDIKPRDDYDEWLKVGMALHSVDQSLLDAWIDWSKGSVYFNEKECIDKWSSFKGDGVAIGTLYYMANNNDANSPRQLHKSASLPAKTRAKFLPSFKQLLASMLEAIKKEDLDKEMEIRSEIMTRFRRTDQQVDAELFKLHTRNIVGVKPKSQERGLDLSRIEAMEWRLDGFIIANDITLIYGSAGCGKTTAALALARSVLLGEGFLHHQSPCAKGNVLFIASDSGASPLVSTMQDMSMIIMPEVQEGHQKRFHVFASDPNQGTPSWDISLSGCIYLLEFIKEKNIDLVFIDSCKAVCSNAGLDYSDNKVVTAILTHIKDVICPHAAVVFLNHDGTQKSANAGAKAWREVPSIVHMIQRPDPGKHDGARSFRQWTCVKSRLGSEWEIHFKYEDGMLMPMQATEKIGSCIDEIVQLLQKADNHALHLNDIVKNLSSGFAIGTIKNNLSKAVKTRRPIVERVPNRPGWYRLKDAQ